MKKIVFNVFLFLLISNFLAAQPRVWNMKKLAEMKKKESPAVQYVVSEANKILTKKLNSVVEKNKPAPSGDIHDYISCGPYWWPDPKNPEGPYIRRDGESNKDVLTSDKKNLSIMTKGIVTLSLAYYLTGNEKYAAKAAENLNIWFLNPDTKMNPNLNFGQTIKGHFNGEGRGAGIIETYSFVDMLDGIELLKKSPAFTKKINSGLNNWFSDYLNWMLTSKIGNQEHNTKNNHGTAFEVQATRIALFLNKTDVAGKFIKEFPQRRIFTQIEADGKQPFELVRTKALHYSTFNLAHMLDMCSIAKTLGMDLFNEKSNDGRSISKGLDYLASFAGKPKDEFPYQQISDWDMEQQKLCWQLYRADKFSASPKFPNLYIKTISSDQKDYNTLLY